MAETTGQAEQARIFPAALGAGPLLQRDYWAVIRDCRMPPSGVVREVARNFPAFAPVDSVRFACLTNEGRPGPLRELQPGDRLSVHIRMAGDFEVRVLHRDVASFTLATVVGHPEAGRITFGAYRNGRGDVIFHIRSRARSGSRFQRAGFLTLGESMQTECWTDFISAVAATVGNGVRGWVHAETITMRRDETDESVRGPTFIARAD